MKKLKLKMQDLNSPQVLSREQLKKVLGGTVPTTSGGGCETTCSSGFYAVLLPKFFSRILSVR